MCVELVIRYCPYFAFMTLVGALKICRYPSAYYHPIFFVHDYFNFKRGNFIEQYFKNCNGKAVHELSFFWGEDFTRFYILILVKCI